MSGRVAGGSAQRVDDAVLELQRAEMSMRDGRMAAAEVARQRGRGAEVHRPVDGAHRRVELLRIARLEAGDFQEHAAGDPRPQAGAIGALERRR